MALGLVGKFRAAQKLQPRPPRAGTCNGLEARYRVPAKGLGWGVWMTQKLTTKPSAIGAYLEPSAKGVSTYGARYCLPRNGA